MAATTRTVLVAVDASNHSKEAFEWYMDNVYRADDMVVICHIPEVPHLPNFSIKHPLSLPVDEWQKAIQDQLEKVNKLENDYSTSLISRKGKAPYHNIHYKLKGECYKSPGEGIIATAESEKADLIVCGTRGLDVIRRTLLGSVSDYVVRHSKVPVLVCPHKHHHGSEQAAEGSGH